MPEPSAETAEGRPSFDHVFCQLLDRLYKRAVLLTGARGSAEDAVHETYLKLASRPERLRLHPEPYAYAFVTLVNVVRDTWRRERRQVPVADVASVSPGRGDDWDGGLGRRSSELEVIRMLGQLSVRQAAAVVLVDLDGYTIDQAAGILGIHRGTVSRSRHRALEKLRHIVNVADDGNTRSAQHAGKRMAR